MSLYTTVSPPKASLQPAACHSMSPGHCVSTLCVGLQRVVDVTSHGFTFSLSLTYTLECVSTYHFVLAEKLTGAGEHFRCVSLLHCSLAEKALDSLELIMKIKPTTCWFCFYDNSILITYHH